MNAAPAAGAEPAAALRWSLLFGNFAIGCGVMVTAGSLNDLTRSLQVSVAVGGQLITIAAVVMALGAPLLAAVVGGWDRRRLLTLSLAWYALGHGLSALMPSYASLILVRAACVLAAAVFTPQAAASIAWLAAPAARGRAITFIFLGWSVASVLGMPLHSFIGETFGWRYAFGTVGVLAAIAAAWVWHEVPDGVRPPAMSLRSWQAVFSHPALMAVVLVTALAAAGQFTVFAYFAPYYRQVLGASSAETSLLFGWFGAFGLLGNLLLSRHVDRFGASRAVALAVALMAVSMLLWPLAASVPLMALVIMPWALGCFSCNSAQQARLGQAAPAWAPALMALNSSAIYLGQAVGAAGGGALVAAHSGETGAAAFGSFHRVGFAWLIAALALSAWASRRLHRHD
ncbi:MFS transporter [Aquincola sp. MAHUQ-54]|uniref:MFS transporter n=1 Tax=Aquincola agrisoli TaxID=3119538 RepID=A0AAW9QE79_9BURK